MYFPLRLGIIGWRPGDLRRARPAFTPGRYRHSKLNECADVRPHRDRPGRRAAGAGPGTETITMTELPTGTITFLFTDIERSTHLWQDYPATMPAALARHDALLRRAIEAQGGVVFKTVGDAFCAAFATAPAALAAAAAAQQALEGQAWQE